MNAATPFPWVPAEAETELRLLFENAPVGLAQCQSLGTVTALNPTLDRMFGDRPKTGRSLCIADLIHPQDRAESERFLREMFDGQRDTFRIDSKTAGPCGRPIRWTAWRVHGTSGKPDYALAMAEDSIESQESEQRLRHAERLESVGRLAGGVAHDFNNLLTGVLLYCDLLTAGLESGHRLRKYAEEIRNASLQATGLVRQLLTVLRPANSESRLLSLNEIVEGMRNLLARLIGENIELKFQLDPGLGLIKMDPVQAQQILLNLVLNARDAMPAGGQISVETSNCKVQILAQRHFGESSAAAAVPCVLFVVGDNGMGMDAETRTHLFEAFFTTKAAGKGTGLGLATVYDIVTGSGGFIHVDSAPGRGTRVTVLLPLIPTATLNSQYAGNSQQEKNEGAIPLQKRS